jgi:hypothetical protein
VRIRETIALLRTTAIRVTLTSVLRTGILTEIADLNTTLNPGATYFAEGQYITPHEYVWCQGHPGQCNMNNNVSYRQYSVSGPAARFSFSPVGSTQRQKAAIFAWTGATPVEVRPDPANDGLAYVVYKVN